MTPCFTLADELSLTLDALADSPLAFVKPDDALLKGGYATKAFLAGKHASCNGHGLCVVRLKRKNMAVTGNIRRNYIDMSPPLKHGMRNPEARF
jgi:hypothetical protein